MTTRETQQEHPTPGLVVGVGASAGGLPAFKQLLASLGDASTKAYVLVQHLDPKHESRIVELLAPSSPMRVVRAVHGAPLHPGTVHVVGPATAARVRDGRIELVSPLLEQGARTVIDILFRSLAEELGSRAAGIVLSGAGSDGAAGLREIRTAGGLTIVQDPATASQPGMPQSAIDMGVADLVLPIEEMPAALERFTTLPPETRERLDLATTADHRIPRSIAFSPEDLDRLAEVLGARADFDVEQYKPGTIERRVLRRMGLGGYGKLEDYIDRLRGDELERHRLARDLLIHVTRFFRDGEAYDVLKSTVLTPMVQDAAPTETLRVWVPGVSTGEEAYSIAMMLLETIEENGAELEFQIFATDPDEAALSVGRKGVYPAAIAEHVSSDRLERFFTVEHGHGFRVRPRLREAVSFAVHDLCKSPPFSRMHLVSCRNVLIYLRPHAQEQVIRTLHFALRSSGHLWLGSHESASNDAGLFTPVSKRWRIFRKLGPSRPLPRHPKGWAPRTRESTEPAVVRGRVSADQRTADLARVAVIRCRVPPTVVVGADDQIVFMHGELGRYLQFPEGELRRDLSSFLRPDLATRTRAGLHRCRNSGETITALSRAEGPLGRQTCITATPAPEVGDGAVVLTFEDVEPSAELQHAREVEHAPHEALVDQLERELRATREDLRNTVEELESSNEELRASNEESISMNEELQSANEELEATAEELRSLNEEVTSVNMQLREKVEELERARDDLINFFASTKLATLFLDTQLRIKRMTPAAEDLLSLGPGEAKRYVGDIARELLQTDLVADARNVLEHLAPIRRELRAHEKWFVRSVLPYQTGTRRVEGVVVTLTDVTELREATERLTKREAQQVILANLGMQALEEPDLEKFMNHAVRQVQSVLDTDYCKILELSSDERSLLLRAGIGWEEGMVGNASVSAGMDSQAGFTLQSRGPVVVDDLATEKRFSGPALLHEHGVTSGVSCSIGEGSDVYGVLGAHTRSRREFTDDDVSFLGGVSIVVASAINRQRVRSRMAMEAAVSKVLAEATSLEAAVHGVHRALAQVLGTSGGELWWPAPDGEALERTVVTVADEGGHPLAARRFAPGEGIIGRVWTRGKAETLVSLEPGADFVRLEEARALGLVSELAFPILSAGRTLGVLVVFSKRRFVRDVQFLRSLEWIGRAIGELVRRLDAEVKMREREDRVRDVFENVGVSVWELDFSEVGRALEQVRSTGVTELGDYIEDNREFLERALREIRVLQVNSETLRLFGAASFTELAGSLDQIFVNETMEVLTKALLAFAGGARSFAGEARLGTLSGGRIDATVTLRMPTVSNGSHRVLASIMDTTALGRARAELEESRRWFEGMTEATPDIVTVYDVLKDRVVYANRETQHVLGYAPDELRDMGEGIAKRMVHPEDLSDLRQFYLGLGRGTSAPDDADGRAPVEEHAFRVVHRSGVHRWLHVRAVPFRTSDGGVVREALVVARDISEFKRVEGDLREASRQKDVYLAMLGHELRNPLAAVRGATELMKLRDGGQDPGLQRIQGILERQTNHMAKLLDGLLDVSRIARGKIELEKQWVSWVDVIRDVIADRTEQIERRGLELRTELPSEPLWIEGDRVRLTQIFDNLLSNAIDYTNPPGTITLSVRHEGDQAVAEVRDTGVGIEQELLPHIFEAFRQAGQSLDRSKGGLGLGLALVKGLVELHGGSVCAKSEGPGQGAEFVVRLPVADSVTQEHSSTESKPDAKRILIVEDNEDAAELLARVLELGGHEVSLATTGPDGVEIAQSFRPEVVLCDLGLPGGMSGFDVARVLRSGPAGPSIVLVALTGYGRPEDKRRSFEAGFDAHLTKPVDLEVLEDVLARKAIRNSADS